MYKGGDQKVLKRKRAILTPTKKRIYECDAESIAYYRRNPIIACQDLL